MNPVLICRDMRFGYEHTPILANVNLEIPNGDFVSIVGPNGSGKTTLLKLALGLLKPDAGSIEVFGLPPVKGRRHIGYVPQHPRLDPLFPVTALDVTLMGRLGKTRVIGSWLGRDRERAMECLDEVGLADRSEHHFASLSGGQKQRVLIARALAGDPEMLLLDEPTSGLDAHVEETFYRLLQKLNEKLTVVLVSHDLGFVSGFVKSVICVGRDVVVHPTSDITGQVIADLYGTDVRLIRHDHRCSDGGHQCQP